MEKARSDSTKQQIRKTMSETRTRRKDMHCRVFEMKVVKNKLSCGAEEHLSRMFLEAKWIWNSTVAAEDVWSAPRSMNSVEIKCGEGYEMRDITALGAHMKQDVVDSVKSSIRGLATKKKNGHKVGRVGFRRFCDSVPLRAHGTDYRIDFSKSTITVANLKRPIKVKGLTQIPSGAEIANARLVRKPSGLYFHVTTYTEAEERVPTGAVGACDFGIKKNFTFHDGREFDIRVPESKSLKRKAKCMNRNLSRKANVLMDGGMTKKSAYKEAGKGQNHKKRVVALQKAYERQNNRKDDKANKLVHMIKDEYDLFAIQDEMIANWHKGLFGRGVQHSAMGKVKAMLKDSPRTIVVSRSYPPTQRCPVCGRDTKHPLKKRDYDCQYCGYHHDSRDQKSASSILEEALNPLSTFVISDVSVDRRAKSPVKATASAGNILSRMGKPPRNPAGKLPPKGVASMQRKWAGSPSL
jgi:transposase